MEKIDFTADIGIIGRIVAGLFGGWDTSLTTLVIFMLIDYISGLVVAGIFKKSKKTTTGALRSSVGWKGLHRKGMTLLIVLIAHRLDLTIGTSFAKDAVEICYICNEAISILENAGLMGLCYLTRDTNDFIKLSARAKRRTL